MTAVVITVACIGVLLRIPGRQGGPLIPLAQWRVHRDAHALRPAPAAQAAEGASRRCPGLVERRAAGPALTS